MARRVVASGTRLRMPIRVRFVRYPATSPGTTAAPQAPATPAALALDDGATLTDEAGDALSLDA